MSQIGTTHSFDLGDGRIVTLETGKLAKQESISKNKKIALIIGGSVLGLALIGLVIYKLKKK